jgi:hypothetical protein
MGRLCASRALRLYVVKNYHAGLPVGREAQRSRRFTESTQSAPKGHDDIFISHLFHSIPQVYQLMNKALSFGFVFSFLYGIKPYIMKHVVKGGILALVVIGLYAFITIVASAL